MADTNRIQILGYFPGTDFDSSSQFGRQIHVYKFIERLAERTDIESKFIVGNDADRFLNANIHSVETEGILPIRFVLELWRAIKMIAAVLTSDLPAIVYTRESPHFAPLIVCTLTDAILIVESNGVPSNVRESVDSRFQYYSLAWVRKWKWEQADHIIAVSEGIAEFLQQNYDVSSVSVVENGVDMEIFNCTHPISSDPPYTIGYVGGLQEHQNIELMLRSFKQVDSEVSFLILGGTKQRQSDLKAFSTDLGIAEEVTFIGRVSHEEVPKYINQMDICFGPFTADRTASPIKVYEYLACGREVITVNDSGLEFLDEYPGVHRITFSSPEQIAEQVEEILNRVETNNVGAEKVQDERSWRTVVDEVVETCLDVRAR